MPVHGGSSLSLVGFLTTRPNAWSSDCAHQPRRFDEGAQGISPLSTVPTLTADGRALLRTPPAR